jgi:hypothetical protein
MTPPAVNEKPPKARRQKARRWVFIGFNLLMGLWLVFGLMDASAVIDQAPTEAAQEDELMHTGVGMVAVFFIWAVGNGSLALLFFLLKPKK